jgi:hypothetical protein
MHFLLVAAQLLVIAGGVGGEKRTVMRYEADSITIETEGPAGERREFFTVAHQTTDLDAATGQPLMTRYDYDDRTETFEYRPGVTVITIKRPGKAPEVKREKLDPEREEERTSQAASARKAKPPRANAKLAGQACVLTVDRHVDGDKQFEARAWSATDRGLDYALGSLQVYRYRLDGKQATFMSGQRLMNVKVRKLVRKLVR